MTVAHHGDRRLAVGRDGEGRHVAPEASVVIEIAVDLDVHPGTVELTGPFIRCSHREVVLDDVARTVLVAPPREFRRRRVDADRAVRGPAGRLVAEVIVVRQRDVGSDESRRQHHVESERREDALIEELRERFAAHPLHDLGEQHVVRVRVLVADGVGESSHAADRVERVLVADRIREAQAVVIQRHPVVAHAARVVHELVERDRRAPRGQPVDVSADRVGERQLPLTLQHQDRGRRELLRDRRHVEPGLGRDFGSRRQVGDAARPRPDDLAAHARPLPSIRAASHRRVPRGRRRSRRCACRPRGGSAPWCRESSCGCSTAQPVRRAMDAVAAMADSVREVRTDLR